MLLRCIGQRRYLCFAGCTVLPLFWSGERGFAGRAEGSEHLATKFERRTALGRREWHAPRCALRYAHAIRRCALSSLLLCCSTVHNSVHVQAGARVASQSPCRGLCGAPLTICGLASAAPCGRSCPLWAACVCVCWGGCYPARSCRVVCSAVPANCARQLAVPA